MLHRNLSIAEYASLRDTALLHAHALRQEAIDAAWGAVARWWRSTRSALVSALSRGLLCGLLRGMLQPLPRAAVSGPGPCARRAAGGRTPSLSNPQELNHAHPCA